MKVYLNEIQGTADAITTMYFSKRTWTRETEEYIRDVVEACTDRQGFYRDDQKDDKLLKPYFDEFKTYMSKLLKFGVHHITMLRYIDFSITVEGLHRAGQDDWDAHACRYNNRIIRSSTRLGVFDGEEMSDWYKGKILTMDQVIKMINLDNIPNELTIEEGDEKVTYVRSTNGYIRKDLKDDKDAKRGLYMECIPSNFIFKVNLTEWAHVYKMRNKDTHANPEVKLLCETIADKLQEANPWFTRELFMSIEN